MSAKKRKERPLGKIPDYTECHKQQVARTLGSIEWAKKEIGSFPKDRPMHELSEHCSQLIWLIGVFDGIGNMLSPPGEGEMPEMTGSAKAEFEDPERNRLDDAIEEQRQRDAMVTAMKGALAALNQNKAHDADVALARKILADALPKEAA